MPKKKPIKKTKPMNQPEPDIISSSIGQESFRRIGFEARRFACQSAMDMDAFPRMHGITMSQFQDEAARRMVLELQAKIASRKFDYKCVRYPDGAWQFIKHNIAKSQAMGIGAVQWWLKKYPVRYVEVEMEANAYNPSIEIPDHDTFVEICTRARYRKEGAYE